MTAKNAHAVFWRFLGLFSAFSLRTGKYTFEKPEACLTVSTITRGACFMQFLPILRELYVNYAVFKYMFLLIMHKICMIYNQFACRP